MQAFKELKCAQDFDEEDARGGVRRASRALVVARRGGGAGRFGVLAAGVQGAQVRATCLHTLAVQRPMRMV